MDSMANSSPKRTPKHLNYIPWEPSRAAVSRTDQNQETRFVPIPSLTTQLYRYQNSIKSPQTAFIAKETSQLITKTKPTATVEPFQASINADEIFYGVRSFSPAHHSASDMNLTGDNPELRSELERVQDENASLRQQLEIQTQVNSELKKLLVASVGTDFQFRLERLLRDKARLELELQGLTNQINHLLEETEKLNIQCDIHQSRSAASRVLIDELKMHKSLLSVQCNDCSDVIQRLLGERSQMAKELIQTYSALTIMNENNLHHARKSHPFSPKFDLIQLSSYIQRLTTTLFNNSKSNFSTQSNSSRNLSIQLELTEAETFALEILQSHTTISNASTASSTSDAENSNIQQLESMINRLKLINRKKSHERFHSTTRYENLTLNCCRDCSGEIHVV